MLLDVEVCRQTYPCTTLGMFLRMGGGDWRDTIPTNMVLPQIWVGPGRRGSSRRRKIQSLDGKGMQIKGNSSLANAGMGTPRVKATSNLMGARTALAEGGLTSKGIVAMLKLELGRNAHEVGGDNGERTLLGGRGAGPESQGVKREEPRVGSVRGRSLTRGAVTTASRKEVGLSYARLSCPRRGQTEILVALQVSIAPESTQPAVTLTIQNPLSAFDLVVRSLHPRGRRLHLSTLVDIAKASAGEHQCLLLALPWQRQSEGRAIPTDE